MPKGSAKETGINKKDPTINNNDDNDNRLYLYVELNEKEKTYFERLASVMSKIHVQDDKKLLPESTLNSLGKMALGLMTNVYLTQVLIQSELAKTLPKKEST